MHFVTTTRQVTNTIVKENVIAFIFQLRGQKMAFQSKQKLR